MCGKSFITATFKVIKPLVYHLSGLSRIKQHVSSFGLNGVFLPEKNNDKSGYKIVVLQLCQNSIEKFIKREDVCDVTTDSHWLDISFRTSVITYFEIITNGGFFKD